MSVGRHVVDGGDGVFEFFSCGGFTGYEAAGGTLEGLFSVFGGIWGRGGIWNGRNMGGQVEGENERR